MKEVIGKLPNYSQWTITSQNMTIPQKAILGSPTTILDRKPLKKHYKTNNTAIINKWAKAAGMATWTHDFQMLGNQL